MVNTFQPKEVARKKSVYVHPAQRTLCSGLFVFSMGLWGKTETLNRKENPLLFWESGFFWGFYFRKSKMAYLLIFVILLHLLTLAMLFIATMEKVVIGVWHVMSVRVSVSAVHCITSHFSFQSWWEWGGLENSDLWYNCRFDNFTGIWLCASSKENGKEKGKHKT